MSREFKELIEENPAKYLLRLPRDIAQNELDAGKGFAPNNLKLVQKYAGEITKVSKDALRDALIIILTGPRRSEVLGYLEEMQVTINGTRTSFLRAWMCQLFANFPPVWEVPMANKWNVWQHTLAMLCAARPKSTLCFMLAVLLHDVGKYKVWRDEEERGVVRRRNVFLDHERVGAELAQQMLVEAGFDAQLIADVVRLIAYHKHLHLIAQGRQKLCSPRVTLRRRIARLLAIWRRERDVLSLPLHLREQLRVLHMLDKSEAARGRELNSLDDVVERVLASIEVRKTGLRTRLPALLSHYATDVIQVVRAC